MFFNVVVVVVVAPASTQIIIAVVVVVATSTYLSKRRPSETQLLSRTSPLEFYLPIYLSFIHKSRQVDDEKASELADELAAGRASMCH